MWLNLATNLISMAIGYLSKHYWSKWRRRRKTAGQAALLTGLDNSTKFVFPPREEVSSSFLPRVSVEDFMAINNMISAYLKSDLEPPSKVADSINISEAEKRQHNLILICSSKTNKVTGDTLKLLKERLPLQADLIPSFEKDPKTKRTFIQWNHGIYPSESFDQKGPEYSDMAIIVKARNPWAGQRSVLIVAGIRGIGTWGAAEFLKKWWKPLYEGKRRPKTGDFVALLKVYYEEYDIKMVKLLHVVDLNPPGETRVSEDRLLSSIAPEFELP